MHKAHTRARTKPAYLSAQDIELKAEEVIEFFHASVLTAPQPTPIHAFARELERQFRVKCDFTGDLGRKANGKKTLGVYRFKTREILVDRSIADTNRFAFTFGHELGHLVLHRNLKVRREDYQENADTARDLVSGKKILTTLRDRLEWQANRFSSALVMPRETFREAVIQCQSAMGIHGRLGLVVVESIPYSLRDFRDLRARVAQLYAVTMTNVKYRMSDLGILVDRRGKDTHHISELLREE